LSLEISSDSRIKDLFSIFIKGWLDDFKQPKYRIQLNNAIQRNANSIIVDYTDLSKYNSDLAAITIKDPIKYLDMFNKVALEFLKEEDPEYAKKVEKHFLVRLRNLPEKNSLRKLDVNFLAKFVAVTGVVVRVSEVKPFLIEAAWKCPKGHMNYIVQKDERTIKKPEKCGECDETEFFTFDGLKSTYINFQVLRIQELPEELPPGQLPRQLDIRIYGDIVDVARPGDRVTVTGILKAEEEYSSRGSRLRTFNAVLEGNYVEVLGKAPEDIVIDKSDEIKFKELAKRPDWIKMLISSFSPSIYGHDLLKEAILLLIVGAPQTTLPDGTSLRGDINILLIGDPGCLVYDERIVLGNGSIVKIGQIGEAHLQRLSVQVLTGERRAKRAKATTYHIYRNQPIMEVITESGKSIKGTFNHPLLTQRREGKRMVQEWKRLDEINVGDRLVVVTSIPCTLTSYLPTEFKPLERSRFGPRFKGKLPKLLTPELASFLGYMLGNGWVCSDGYRFGFAVSESEKDIIQRLCSMVENLFGLRTNVRTRVRRLGKVITHYAYYCNMDINHNLKFLRKKRVPELILSSGNKVVASFLRWLYEADGTIFNEGRIKGAIGLKAKNIELLRDIQILLLRFAIDSKIVDDTLVIQRRGDIARFDHYIGFVSRKKKDALAQLLPNKPKFQKFNKQRTERVVKVVKAGETADVYDIEVPGKHRFIANGIISHNTAKSELLKYSARLAPRGLYTSGKGSTAAGLTAAMVREKSGMLMLEAGAVVLADQGICAIDEFDKMSSTDRQALHEAMEQQTVSVAKGGIVVTLNARTSILSAANPLLGKYDPYKNLAENINLPSPLLTRFDLIFVIRDVPERAVDEQIASHIMAIRRSRTFVQKPPLDIDFLRKYLLYCKNIQPVITPEAERMLIDFYLEMRSQVESQAIPVTPRQLESLIRLAIARARLLLRNEVTKEDAAEAITLTKNMLYTVAIDKKTGKIDMGTITGVTASERSKLEIVFQKYKELAGPANEPVELNTLIKSIVETGKFNEVEAKIYFSQLEQKGVFYMVKPGYYRRA